MADSVHYQKRIVTHVLVATFIGLHVPLTCMVLYALLTGSRGLFPSCCWPSWPPCAPPPRRFSISARG